MERIKAFLNSVVGGVLPDALGKGPGIVALSFFIIGSIDILVGYCKIEGATVAAALGPIVGVIYSTSLLKAHSDNKAAAANGGANGK